MVELLKRKENSAGIGAGPLKGCVRPVLQVSPGGLQHPARTGARRAAARQLAPIYT